MALNSEQKPEIVSEIVKKRQKADLMLLKMFSLKGLPEQRITEREQKEFGKRIAKGDQIAKEEYILRRLRFAMMAAMDEEGSQPESNSLTLEDCFQNIIEALKERLDEYPMHDDQDFAEYVGWARRKAERENKNTSTLIRIPIHIYEKWGEVDKFITNYISENDREPSEEEIAAAIGLSKEDLVQLQKDKQRRDLSNFSLELAEGLGCKDTEVFDQVYIKIKKEKINHLLKVFSHRERRVIELRFGLSGDELLTQTEVGQLLNLSHTMIGRIEKRVLSKLEILLLNQDTRIYWLN